MPTPITLNGSRLRIADVYALSYNPKFRIRLSSSTLALAKEMRIILDKESTKKIIYGVNTGFGPMASHIIGRGEIDELQVNLIRGHAVGMGAPLPEEYVVAAMVVRLNTLAKGHSAVSAELLKRLEQFINERIVPVVPEHGAVGTSGDLVQLAHIALALIGEGEVFYRGKRERTATVLKRLNIPRYVLKPKEGLSLINGTSMMAGINALLCVEAQKLISISIQSGALALELTHGFDDAISKELHAMRPHPGQQAIAEALRKLLASSRLLRQRKNFQKRFVVTDATHTIPEGVQEIYSLRCIPQIVGPVFDILSKTLREVTTEINSVTDNPILDINSKKFLHGGNFHGDYMAAAIDQLKISLVKLTMLSERRINFFLNQKINGMFPPFMNLKKPGLTMGLQGLQFVATSTTAVNQTLAFPQHIHSIPTNGDNQDIVSMGTDAALLAARVVENAYIVLAIEALTLAQAVDFSGNKKQYASTSRKNFADIRKIFPAVIADREIAPGLEKVLRHIKRSVPLALPW
jgi:histidine ammonia-lyase